jgi:hypothetical protein
MPKPYTYRDLVKALRAHDRRFEVFEGRGKGSERIIYHPDVDGSPRSHPVKHHGAGTELRKSVISSIIRRFKLPKGVL